MIQSFSILVASDLSDASGTLSNKPCELPNGFRALPSISST
jgi:hypothetical protein